VFLNNSITNDSGGAVFGNTDMTFNRCSFIGNAVPAIGGAVAVVDATLTVTDCQFTGNKAYFAVLS
jgi:hypothetical protein